MSRIILVASLLVAAVVAGLYLYWLDDKPAGARAGTGEEGTPPLVTVMTRNLYLGADLTPVIASAMNAKKVDVAFTAFLRTRVDLRMAAIADEIAAARPALIGLQEASIWSVRPRAVTNDGGGEQSEAAVKYDSLQILLGHLESRALEYELVIASNGFDVSASGQSQDFRLTDREAILVKVDSGLVLSAPRAGTFTAAARVPGPSGPIQALRGWASVDVGVDGRTFRFMTSHLSLLSPKVQGLQAAELLQGPAATDLPLVLVGDFNSAAAGEGYDTPTYEKLMSSGFTDGWTATHPDEPGLTGCQPKSLDNNASSLRARIDLVLLRGLVEVSTIDLVGNRPRQIAPDLFWASDHAGLVARLRLP